MLTKYKKFVICKGCNGLGKIEKEFVKEIKTEVENDAKEGEEKK